MKQVPVPGVFNQIDQCKPGDFIPWFIDLRHLFLPFRGFVKCIRCISPFPTNCSEYRCAKGLRGGEYPPRFPIHETGTRYLFHTAAIGGEGNDGRHPCSVSLGSISLSARNRPDALGRSQERRLVGFGIAIVGFRHRGGR